MATRTFDASDVNSIPGGWQFTGKLVHKRGRWFAVCLCACGKRQDVKLTTGGRLGTKMCQPCSTVDSGALREKHGHCVSGGVSLTYSSWWSMHTRCERPCVSTFPNYGGRGIRVCERWSGPDGFRNFLADMGERPSKEHQIDRVDGDGHYEPSNCRWATRKQNARNRRTNKLLTMNGQTMTVVEWCERYGVDRSTFTARMQRGWPMIDALTLPLQPPGPNERHRAYGS